MLPRVGVLVTLALGILLAPLACDAQQPAKAPRIGYLMAGPEPRFMEAFRQGLRELGYVEGRKG